MTTTTTPAHQAATIITNTDRIFALTGAGTSTASGIDDFRGPDGIWTRNPAAMRMFDIHAYRTDPAVRALSWEFRRSSPIRTAAPNPAHHALAAWQDHHRTTIATQNIDGLHQAAGSTDVLELHGTFWEWRCLDCGDRGPISAMFDRIDAGDPDPRCRRCGGITRTDTVAFGEQLPTDVLTDAVEAAKTCGTVIAVGTSLTVHPAAGLVDIALHHGAQLIIVNAEPTPYDPAAAVVVRDPIPDALTTITDHIQETTR